MATASRPPKAAEAFVSGADVVVESLARHGVDTALRKAGIRPGDTVRIEMLDDQHHSIFGAIEQTVAGV